MTLPDGRRVELAWRSGYSARFTPALEVLDEHSKVIAREGSLISGTCGTAEFDVSLPEFDTAP